MKRSPVSSLAPALLLGAGLLLVSILSLVYDLPELGSKGQSFVLIDLRAPRLLIGMLVGAVLGVVGAAFQALFQNPLATPSTLGTTAGATLFAFLGLLVPVSHQIALPTLGAFAFAGALLTTLVVAGVATRTRTRLEEVLLAGVALSLAAGAISQALQLLADAHQTFAAAQWSMGQLPQIGYERVTWLVVPAALTVGSLIWLRKPIALSALGEDYATSFGLDCRKLRVQVLAAACLGVGATVAMTGPILFVGLIVPHVLRRAVSPSPSGLLPLSALGGATFLVASDFLGRELISGREIPVGVITAGIGAPLLFFLVVAQSNPKQLG